MKSKQKKQGESKTVTMTLLFDGWFVADRVYILFAIVCTIIAMAALYKKIKSRG
jgi:hypothetical protein